jgi:hypothetical protein
VLEEGTTLILPTHSRRVKVISSAEFPNMEDIIGSLTYETTDYCIYLSSDSQDVLGVYEVFCEKKKPPFTTITGLQEIGLGVPKRLIHEPEVDLSNVLDILLTLKRHDAGQGGPEIITITGKHEHMTFAFCDRPLMLPEIQVIDVVPPSPSKLQEGFKVLHHVGVVPRQYPVTFHLVDEVELVDNVANGSVLVPCRLTDLQEKSTKKHLFSVDKDMHFLGERSPHIIGCQRTREAAEACGLEVASFKSMCPTQNLPEEGIFIAKCCLTRSEVQQHNSGNATGVIIPWGFNYAQLFQAATILQEIVLHNLNER